MFIIRLSRLSMTTAEDLLARIWCALEEHNIARPILAVKPDAEGGLNVGFTFRTKQEIERITSAVPSLAPAGGSGTAPLLVDAGWAR
jgi:hypothetical protein